MSGYRVIYCDPPWDYNSRAVHAKTRFGGGAASRYDVMPAEEIAGLGRSIRALADPAGSLMFMWATMPRLPAALAVMGQWGWEYTTTAFTWVKTYPKNGKVFAGPGFWTRSNVEIVLLGKRGAGWPRPVSHSVPQVEICPHPRSEDGKIIHSRKPWIFRDRIVELVGDVPRVEVFARTSAPGWDVIGNQLEGDGAIHLVPDLDLFAHARREQRLARLREREASAEEAING